MYGFYREVYLGKAISAGEFPRLVARARAALEELKRRYRVSGSPEAEKMALCAMAEAIDYFEAAQNGEGGLRYASVGTVSISGKGIYSQIDISPQAQAKELRRCASRYLEIYRGVAG